MQIQYYTADVFTNQVFGGAQVAVIPEAEGLQSDETLQHIAAEFDLPATVFVRTLGENRFSLRLFTPLKEIDFGTHTTVAAAHVLADIGKIKFTAQHTPIEFQHKDSLLKVHVTHDNNKPVLTQLSMTTKPIVDNFVPSREELADILGINSGAVGIKDFKTLLVSNNGVYVIVPVHRLEDLCAATFNHMVWEQTNAASSSAQHLLLFSQHTETPGSDFHLRLLGPQIGVNDNPPIGSSVPAFAAYLCSHPHIKKGTYSFIAERGLKQQRQSLLNIELDNKPGDQLTLRVGGSAVMVCEGKINC